MSFNVNLLVTVIGSRYRWLLPGPLFWSLFASLLVSLFWSLFWSCFVALFFPLSDAPLPAFLRVDNDAF
jgi:hypothetical protein